MKPKIYEEWEQALSFSQKAEKLYEDGKFKEAAKEADSAIIFGLHTIGALAKELDINDLFVIQGNALNEWYERTSPESGGKHHTPKENVEWARKTLKRLSDELPPDTLRRI
ncbi:MAG: hypothetical protein GY774_17095 [Planctomycetes bacterium]|nr:hypothetical protein [Planctomycetota bacterium]